MASSPFFIFCAAAILVLFSGTATANSCPDFRTLKPPPNFVGRLCARLWRGRGVPDKHLACNGKVTNVEAGTKNRHKLTLVGSLVVKTNCSLHAYELEDFIGREKEYGPGLYPMNRYFRKRNAPDHGGVSRYGWGSHKCWCGGKK